MNKDSRNSMNIITRKKTKAIIYILTSLILVCVIFIAFQQRVIINNIIIRFSGFQNIGRNIYFSPLIKKSLLDSLTSLVHLAEKRNKLFWSVESLDYTIIFCSSKAELEEYTGNSEIQTLSHLTPFGTYIVLGQMGYNLDIISHEMSHSVLLQKTGFKAFKRIPTWFNEGVALQVDYRKLMMDSTIESGYITDYKYLMSISKFSGFHKENRDETRYHYLISRYEIKRWLNSNNSKLDRFLKGIDVNTEFYQYYKKFD